MGPLNNMALTFDKIKLSTTSTKVFDGAMVIPLQHLMGDDKFVIFNPQAKCQYVFMSHEDIAKLFPLNRKYIFIEIQGMVIINNQFHMSVEKCQHYFGASYIKSHTRALSK